MKKILIALSFIGFTGCAQDNTTTVMELQGRVAMKGSAPHSYLSIRDTQTHKSYKIENPKPFGLGDKQNHIVKLKAKVLKDAVGPGFPAVIEVLEVK